MDSDHSLLTAFTAWGWLEMKFSRWPQGLTVHFQEILKIRKILMPACKNYVPFILHCGMFCSPLIISDTDKIIGYQKYSNEMVRDNAGHVSPMGFSIWILHTPISQPRLLNLILLNLIARWPTERSHYINNLWNATFGFWKIRIMNGWMVSFEWKTSKHRKNRELVATLWFYYESFRR